MSEPLFLDLLAHTVERQPDRTALRAHGPEGACRELSYGELAARVSQQGRALRRRSELSEAAEPRVALAFEHRLDLVVGMLTVLEAGAAFLPLDLEMPAQRLAYLLEDSGADLVLTRERSRSSLPESAPRTVSVEELASPSGGEPVERDRRGPLDPQSLAYTIYTSGSTGLPKGVLVTHRGLANLTAAQPLGLRPDDIVLQAASPSFDASILEIFATLQAGATLDLGRSGPSPVGTDLVQWLRREQISAAVLTPSVIATLPSDASAALPALRVLMTGGEACPARLAKAWAGGREFLNGYGPTETTVCVTVAHCAANGGAPPLGRAIAGAHVEVVDGELRPVVGAGVGELVIGGVGLARGYHRRPALTAEHFVPDPIRGDRGARLYRSGDLVRRRPDGELEFLGRGDSQVKIHGCRVELGEIEAALAEIPAVAEAAVVARAGRLAAFVVARGEARPTPGALRQALAQRLPPYMLPATYTLLDALPLSVSGKTDRAALAELPAAAAAGGGAPARLPHSPLERHLAELWAEILECSEVGLDDDFFELGGHSLHAMQLTSRLREGLGVEIRPRLLFQHPTLARLALVLGGQDAATEPQADSQAQTQAHTKVQSQVQTGSGPQRLPRGEPLALTAPQRQLWYLDQLQRTAQEPAQGGARAGDASYNMMVAVRFGEPREGRPLDLAALRRCLDVIVERHEVLRTRFVVVDGEPRQQIEAGCRAPFAAIDLTGADAQSWQRRARALTEGLLRRPFDLARDVMLRAAAVLGPDDHQVVLTMHHIASDGWSIGVLLRELSTLYRSFRADPAAAPLAPLALQYADVAHWQDQVLDGPRRQQLLDYWRRQLDGAPQNLELPTDHPRAAGRAAQNPGASYEFALSSAQLAGLQALGRGRGATLFMTLLAAWSALLYRYCWQRDLLHSVPFASRLHPASEGLLGFFTNMLVIRIGLCEERGAVRSFGDLLAATRETCLDAFAHQDLPFIQLVEALRPERHSGRMPFVQVGFALQNAFRTDRAFPGLEIVPTDVHTGASRFEIGLSMMQEDGQLTGSFEYRSDLFDRTTIVRLADGLSALVDAVTGEPETPVDRLTFLSPSERHQLVHELARNDRPFDLTRCVHHWVKEQISRRPQAESARCAGQSLSYGELGQAAARLAQRLRRHGVVSGSTVGLLLDRCLELPVALLAVLQAGGVCVPLDPDHPADRLRYMLGDTAAAVVVTQPHLRRRMPEDWQGVVLEVADALAGPAGPAAGPAEHPPSPDPGTGPGSLAYIVYTSGSTGMPKGVLMHHRGLCNRLLWQQDAYPLAPGDRVLQNLSIGFDAAIWQLFGPLIAGATIVLPRPGGHMDTAYLARFLVEESVTCADFVPSLLTPLLEAATVTGGQGWAPALRQIVSGGEALHRELAGRVFAALPSVRLLNIYGPTETSLTITAATCERAGTSPTVAIGRPIANTCAYLLDALGQPVPAGVVGEIYAAGVGITVGYLNRPGLTAERFLPDPFAEEPGGRLYRTGDLARRLPDGAFEFLGRADQQVKIRGVRIELGEIEARLQQLEGVADAAVLARTDVPGAAAGEKRLVAYVVTDSSSPAGCAATPSTLRAGLGDRLPPAMVPGIYLFLPEMPVTVNGKIDRKALPAPEGTAEGAGRSLVPPRDRMEAELVAIWCQALSLEELSVTDHFFDLGGHSLLAVKLMSEVQGRLGVRLDVAELYAAGTVEEMASLLRGRTRTSLPGSLVELAVAPGTAGDTSEAASLVCVHAVDGAAHGYAHLARLLGGATAVYGCQAPGLDDGADLAAEILEDFEALAAYHADALATLLPRGEFILCGWSTGGLLASAMACRLEELGRAPERLILLDTHLARSAEEPSRTESAEETAFETAFAAIGTELGAQREFFAQMLLGPAGAASPDSDSGPDPGDPGDPGDWRSSDLAGSEEAFLRRLSELAVGLGRLPAGAEAAQLERRWQVFRRLVQASSGYRPRPHRCPITLIQAAGVPASIGERQAAACRALTLGPFEVETVAADHHGMLRPEAVFEVADRVARWLRSGKEVAEHATV